MSRIKKKTIGLFILLVIFSINSEASLFKRKINQADEKKIKQGWWISYWDDDKKIICNKTYYKDGLETKICKNYYSSGLRQSKFRYYKNKVKVKYYDENGLLTQKGWAIIDYSSTEIRFYWEGKWKFFNKFRAKISESEYLDGKMISEQSFIK